jgi:hypothetical protein
MFVVDGKRWQDDIAVLETGDTAVNLGGERLDSRSVGFAFGSIQPHPLDLGEVVFSEHAGNIFFVAHGDVPK